MLAVLLLAAGWAAGRLTSRYEPAPQTFSAEAGFARDMQVHHQQAVDMSLTVRDRTDDEEIRQLAYDIATTQGQQAGQMYGWLADWGLPQAPAESRMAWMAGSAGHATHQGGSDAEMPGMASAADLAWLRTLDGVEAEKLYLQLMLPHHEGGIEMARAAVELCTRPSVVGLAENIIDGQTSEISYMEQLLASR